MLFAELGNRVELHGLIDVGEDLHRHQIGDDLERLYARAVREILDSDRQA